MFYRFALKKKKQTKHLKGEKQLYKLLVEELIFSMDIICHRKNIKKMFAKFFTSIKQMFLLFLSIKVTIPSLYRKKYLEYAIKWLDIWRSFNFPCHQELKSSDIGIEIYFNNDALNYGREGKPVICRVHRLQKNCSGGYRGYIIS